MYTAVWLYSYFELLLANLLLQLVLRVNLSVLMAHVYHWTKCVMVSQTVWEGRMRATLYVQTVKMMEISVSLMAAQRMKEEWSTAGMEHGALCVMIPGTL